VGSEPATIRRDIEITRERLGANLDLLEEKINPKKVAAREGRDVKRRVSVATARFRPAVDAAGGKVREGASRVRPAAGAATGAMSSVAGQARRNPKATGAVAGAALLAAAGTVALVRHGRS
jgi:Protein of unknown function (DUF3618)